MVNVPIDVMAPDVWRAWRRENVVSLLELPLERAPFTWLGWGFMWVCPTCGWSYYGVIGTEAVGGWDGNQQWVNDGSEELPTLSPSLGCRGMLDGAPGVHHWWLRDGALVAA